MWLLLFNRGLFFFNRGEGYVEDENDGYGLGGRRRLRYSRRVRGHASASARLRCGELLSFNPR